MIEIIPFKSEHLEKFDGKLGEEWITAHFDIGKLLSEFSKHGAMFTVFVDGRVVAIAGLMGLWKGVGEVWAAFAPGGERYMKTIHRKSKEVIAEALNNGFWRIQTNVIAGFDKGIRWVERLGFKSEGVMRKYSPNGGDMIRYAIVREGLEHAS